MSTSSQVIPTQTLEPAEQIRLMGQNMGLWNHGFDFPRSARQLFRGVDLKGKALLEIGCGKGILCLWAAAHGAKEVTGLEPLAEGAYDSSECHQAFRRMARELQLPQAQILPNTIQDFDSPPAHYDIVLSVASINHLDEKNCVLLGSSEAAENAYKEIFRTIASIMKPGGRLIVVDAARRNLFGDLGFRNPMSPNIEWFKHQQPAYWARILSSCGFCNPQISWTAGRLFRYVGISRIPGPLSYLGQSIFRLEMTKVA